ncbi:MAG: alpha/beta fold hydrolase [Methylohalobius sp. ZOD2]|nr:alpha/beta fold hydrolase [Methylothermaceae bacterium]
METVDLYCKRFGDEGPPLLILHGLFGAGRNWYSLAQRLAGEFQVLVPDLRGHGESPHAAPLDYPHMATDLAALLAREGVQSTHLLGHSMGGKVAMRLALSRPDLVSKLVVADIAPVQYAHSFDHVVEALKALPLDQVTSRRQADEWLAPRIENPVVRQFLLQNLITHNSSYDWRVDLDLLASALPALSGFPLDATIQPFAGPTLFVSGGLSEYIKPAYHQAIRSLFPQARIKTIEHAGHWIHIDQPDCFESTVRCFLREAD